MIIEICLVIISVMLVILVGILLITAIKAHRSFKLLDSDLHQITIGTANLIADLKDLTENVKEKAKSLNFLTYPLRLLHNKKDSNSSLTEENKGKENFLQLIKWVALSATLIRFTKEVIRRNGK